MDVTRTALLLVAAVLIATAPATAQGLESDIDAEPQVSPDGQEVVIETVELDDDGWVVIHPEDPVNAHEPDTAEVQGKTYVEAGSHSNVSVNLSSELILNQSLYAMLHYDDPADETFTFLTNEGEDPPVEQTQPYVERQFFGNVSVSHFFVIVGEEDNEYWRKVAEKRNLEKENARQEQVKEELEERIEQNESTTDGSDGGTDDESTDETANETDGEGEEQPGFAVVGALAAMLAAALVALRR